MSKYEYHVWYEAGTKAAKWALKQHHRVRLNSGEIADLCWPETTTEHGWWDSIMALYPAELPPPSEPEVEIEYFVKYGRETHPAEFRRVWKTCDYVEWFKESNLVAADNAGTQERGLTHTIMAIPPLADIPGPGERVDPNPWLEPGSEEAKAWFATIGKGDMIEIQYDNGEIDVVKEDAFLNINNTKATSAFLDVRRVRRPTHYVPEGGE